MAIDVTELIKRYDKWTRAWNQQEAGEIREDIVEFARHWRNQPGDWLKEVSDQFYDRIHSASLLDVNREDEPWLAPQRLHLANHVLWHLEDEARRDDIPDSVLVDLKRVIDAVNQKRNDCMEQIDELVINLVDVQINNQELPVHGEPPGLIYDRLSILSLKFFHYGNSEGNHEQNRIKEQRSDLASALERLLDRLKENECRVKIYRQFKTYNDPDTNPALDR